jgi:hypothetical protein
VAAETFSTVNTDVSGAITGLNSAPGNLALNSFSNLTSVSSPFRVRAYNKPGEISAAISAGLVSVRQMLMKATSNNRVQGTAFNFADKKGTYTWNFINQAWDYASGGDIIKIDYPKDDAAKANNTNNAELQITAYTETSIGSEYYPTNIQAAIYTPIGTKQLGLTLTASGYDNTGNPNKASISLFVNPYTISFSFDNSQATSVTESFSFSEGSTVYIGTSATAIFASAADKANGNPSSLTGYLQLENVRFNVAIDGAKASNNPNDFVVITVTVNGGVAGHVIWVTNQQTQEQVAYIKYNDGTQEALETVFADLKTQLGSLGI